MVELYFKIKLYGLIITIGFMVSIVVFVFGVLCYTRFKEWRRKRRKERNKGGGNK